MQSLLEYINESKKILSVPEMCKLLKSKFTKRNWAFVDQFFKNLEQLNQKYSLTAPQKGEAERLYGSLVGKINCEDVANIKAELHLTNPASLYALLIENVDAFNECAGKKIFVTNKSVTTEREYKKWKESDSYTPLEDYDPNKEYYEDEEHGRPVVIYYRWDPFSSTDTKVTYVKGSMADPNTEHQINMAKVDWHYATGNNYMTAYPILLTNYRAKDKDALMNYSDDDLSEI